MASLACTNGPLAVGIITQSPKSVRVSLKLEMRFDLNNEYSCVQNNNYEVRLTLNLSNVICDADRMERDPSIGHGARTQIRVKPPFTGCRILRAVTGNLRPLATSILKWRSRVTTQHDLCEWRIARTRVAAMPRTPDLVASNSRCPSFSKASGLPKHRILQGTSNFGTCPTKFTTQCRRVSKCRLNWYSDPIK